MGQCGQLGSHGRKSEVLRKSITLQESYRARKSLPQITIHRSRFTIRESPVTGHQSPLSKRHRPISSLKLRQRHHVNRIPRAAFQERAIRTLTGTEFAPDAKQGIDDNTPKRRMILVRRPIHAVGNRAVLDTCWRPCATRAAFH